MTAELTVCCAVQPATDAVQKAVKDNVDRGTADLTKDNAALAALVGQLEGLKGQQSPGGVCPESCLDLGKYPMLHSSACVCAHQALGHMHDLALHARYLGAVAVAGVFPGRPSCMSIPCTTWHGNCLCCLMELSEMRGSGYGGRLHVIVAMTDK